MIYTCNTQLDNAAYIDKSLQQHTPIDLITIDRQSPTSYNFSEMTPATLGNNNHDDLAAAHWRLVNAAHDLVEELYTETSAHPNVYEMAVEYLDTIDCNLEDVLFATVRKNGERFNAIIYAAKADISNGDLPPFEEEQDESLNSLMDLHDLFMRTYEQNGGRFEQNEEAISKTVATSTQTAQKQASDLIEAVSQKTQVKEDATHATDFEEVKDNDKKSA